MKYIMFSRFFPAYHPRKGQPTHFVEKIWQSLVVPGERNEELYRSIVHYGDKFDTLPLLFDPKHHTIRAGNRFTKGEQFLPKVWLDKPYCSKQYAFAPPITITDTWEVKIENKGSEWSVSTPSQEMPEYSLILPLFEVAKNDGLLVQDFQDWFNPNPRKDRTFEGQIIFWSDKAKY